MKIELISSVLVLGLAACAGEVNEPRSRHVPADDVTPAHGEGWVDELAASVEPCGAPDLALCERATNGACGVVELAPGDAQCLPAFQWGVTAAGVVEFASSRRVFTIDGLVDAPLSVDERAEAAALMTELRATANAGDASEGDAGEALTPLVSVSHSGICTLSTWCSGSAYYKFVYHYNSASGEHTHRVSIYRNTSNPSYYCNQRTFVQTINWGCGS